MIPKNRSGGLKRAKREGGQASPKKPFQAGYCRGSWGSILLETSEGNIERVSELSCEEWDSIYPEAPIPPLAKNYPVTCMSVHGTRSWRSPGGRMVTGASGKAGKVLARLAATATAGGRVGAEYVRPGAAWSYYYLTRPS